MVTQDDQNPDGPNETVHTAEVIPTTTIELKVPKLSGEFLVEHPEFQDLYDTSKEVLIYPKYPSIPEEFYNNLLDLLPGMKPDDLIVLDPLMKAVAELQTIKELKENPEDFETSNRTYIDTNKVIGSYNSSLTASTKKVKEPYKKQLDQINDLFKHFKLESTNASNAFEANFEKTVLERARRKEEAENKKRQGDTQKIEQLSQQNEQNVQALANQTKLGREAIIEKEMLEISSKANEAIPNLNTEGLTQLRARIDGLTFDTYFTDADAAMFTEEESDDLLMVFGRSKGLALDAIDRQIQFLGTQSNLQTVTHQHEVLKASVPLLEDDANDMPFQVAPPQPDPAPQPEQVQPEEIKPLDDTQKMYMLISELSAFKEKGNDVIEQLKGLEFEQPFLTTTRDKLVNESFTHVMDWIEKMEVWAGERSKKFEEWKASQQPTPGNQ